MTDEPLADVRDMYMAHTMFRREFRLAPALVRAVADGDAERVAIVSDHLRLVDTMLDHHHRSEDDHLWHLLLERARPEAEPVVRLMEEQHGDIEKRLAAIRDGLDRWRETAGATEANALADSIAGLDAPLGEHLDLEEQRALPLIERHVTQAEWGQMVAAGAADVPPEQMPLLFGLMAYEGDPATVRDIVASMPPEVSSVIGDLSARAFAEHALQVYGTATPERAGSSR